ncbi:hypothetical protein EWM64_g6193, partial [Hericium alpestre]
EIHSRLQRHVKHRLQGVKAGKGLDWATAEAMAFGSLMLEGCDVRISGQDVGRGTFSQRHAMLVDQKSEAVVVPLNAELQSKGRLELANSSLSEMAVMGFEFGVSWERPNMLPIWEAQFGDFFNGAQVIIDTFISSAETKWLKQSGIVLLLPHGLDGAGPEHSSSRMERMLQLSDDPYVPNESGALANVNMHVVFPTTPAQYFHLLRRQIKRNFRKPLIVAAPKGLLRLPAASSPIAGFEPSLKFKPVLDDPAGNQQTAERVVLVSGKVYYDLAKERQARGLEKRVALVRVEELSPFPFGELERVLEAYANGTEIRWVQEEPRNQGAYGHVAPRLGWVLRKLGRDASAVKYVGRCEAPMPAPGVGKAHRACPARSIDPSAVAPLDMTTKTQTSHSSFFPRIGFRSASKGAPAPPPPQQPPDDDDDWFTPYNGPYEVPTDMQHPHPGDRDSWGAGLHSAMQNEDVLPGPEYEQRDGGQGQGEGRGGSIRRRNTHGRARAASTVPPAPLSRLASRGNRPKMWSPARPKSLS